MKGGNRYILIAAILLIAVMTAGTDGGRKRTGTDLARRCRIMFYNTENLFDCIDDSLTTDEEFTPAGQLHWTRSRYEKKISNLYKVITAAGEWQPPDIVGICEVENRNVLEDLFHGTPLSKFGYSIVHKESGDPRGIDVALAFRDETIKYISSSFISLSKYGILTRDILYLKCMTGKDTLHVFINHWPSRSSGQLETEPLRIAAARELRRTTDSIFTSDKHANIIIAGDFNDTPSDVSITDHLGALAPAGGIYHDRLYNMTPAGIKRGTIKYQGTWFVFDQFIISGAFLANSSNVKTRKEGFAILDFSFLLTEDETNNGDRPFRTYSGYRYEGGFSDHLPVYIDLY